MLFAYAERYIISIAEMGVFFFLLPKVYNAKIDIIDHEGRLIGLPVNMNTGRC